MAEPASTTVSVGVATGALTIAGTVAGIPGLVLLAALFGSALAVAPREKPTFTASAAISAATAFAVSLGCGIFVGYGLGLFVHLLSVRYLGVDITPPVMCSAWSFVVAFGAQKLLPAAIDGGRDFIGRLTKKD